MKRVFTLMLCLALLCAVIPAGSLTAAAAGTPELTASYIRFADVAAEEANYTTQKPWLNAYGYTGDGEGGMSLGKRLPEISKTLDKNEAGMRVKAVTAIANNGDAAANAFFCLAYYENGALVDVDCKQVAVDAGVEASVSAEVTAAAALGETAQVKALAWDGSASPILPPASYPSSNADLKDILIDGEPLTGFMPNTTTYEIQNQPVAPIIKGVPADSGAKAVTAVNYEKQTADITVTASGGNQKVYHIDVVSAVEPFAVTNYQQLYNPEGSLKGKILSEGFEVKNVTSASDLGDFHVGDAYTDETWRPVSVTSMPGILGDREGYPAIIPARGWSTNAAYKEAWMSDPGEGGNGREYVDWYSFDINRTADVMIIASNQSLPEWTAAEGWQTDAGDYGPYLITTSVGTSALCAAVKRFEVTDGSLTVTMKAPGLKRNLRQAGHPVVDTANGPEPYWVIVRPVSGGEAGGFAEPIGNLTPLAKKVTVDTSGGSPAFTLTDESLDMSQFSIQKGFGQYDVENGKYTYPYANLTIETQGNQYQFINDVAGEYMLDGCYYIREQSLGIAGRMEDDAAIAYQAVQDWYSFDLLKSADVFAFMEGKNMLAEAGAAVDEAPGFEQYGWTELPLPDASVVDRYTDDNGEHADVKQWFARTQLWNGPPQANNYIKCYKLSVDASDGAQTVTIPTKGAPVADCTNPGAARQNWNLVIVVRFK